MRPTPWLLAVAAAACAAPRASAPVVELRWVETAPIETSLNHPDIPDAKDVWPELVSHAQHTLDLAVFYAVDEQGHFLTPVLAAIEAAARRGVKVRVLAEDKFHATYPQTLDWLATLPGTEVRRLKMAQLAGGVMHAKYFVIDGCRAYLGSQNLDWRSLEHIQELGAELQSCELGGGLEDVFETDWALAGGGDRAARVHHPRPAQSTLRVGSERIPVTLVASPQGWLPDESRWDLPKLVALIDGAHASVRVQLLTYKSRTREGERFGDLEDALLRAARRGVDVRLLLSHWAAGKGNMEALVALDKAGVQVRIETIPRWSGGEIPFARVIHAKYMAVDGERLWMGTSNWEKDYFTQTRNVGLILASRVQGARLESFFDDGWTGPYTRPIGAGAADAGP